MAEFGADLLGFLLTLALYATVLLGMVWLLERGGMLRNPAWAEALWRAALFGALLTAPVSYLDLVGINAGGTESSQASSVVVSEPKLPATPMHRSSPQIVAASPRVRAEPIASADDANTTLPLPRSLIEFATQAWLASTLAALLLLLWRGLSVLRWQRRALALPRAASAQQQQAQELARQLELRSPELRVDANSISPAVLPDRTVLLPPWAMRLPAAQSRAMLAHELAHLARRDPIWRVAQHLARAPLSLHPLAWLACRRLDDLAERQADAQAARLLGDGRALAECLAYCLSQRLQAQPISRHAPRWAMAMAERPGPVVERVQHLLENDAMNDTSPSPLRRRLTIAVALLACLSLPTIAVTAFADGMLLGHSISIHSGDDGEESVEVSLRDGGYRFSAEMAGKITFAPDERDVATMAADAELDLEQTQDGVTRRVRFTPAASGVQREYWIDGDVRPFDADAKAWLAQALPELFRATAIDAEARSRRILARGGVDALLAEITLIRGDYGRARYLGLLYQLTPLTTAQQDQALELMRGIGSDYELRQALTQALKAQTLAPEQQQKVLELAANLGSDYERAELLIEAAPRFALDEQTFPFWAKAVRGISSDYEHRRVLEALLAQDGDSVAIARLAFAAAADIGSDYEKRQVLEAGVRQARSDAQLQLDYLRAAADIGSDYERKETVVALLRGGSVNADTALAALDAIQGIGSSYECKEALLALAAVMPVEPAVVERYRAVARRLSTYERGEAEQALDRHLVVL